MRSSTHRSTASGHTIGIWLRPLALIGILFAFAASVNVEFARALPTMETGAQTAFASYAGRFDTTLRSAAGDVVESLFADATMPAPKVVVQHRTTTPRLVSTTGTQRHVANQARGSAASL